MSFFDNKNNILNNITTGKNKILEKVNNVRKSVSNSVLDHLNSEQYKENRDNWFNRKGRHINITKDDEANIKKKIDNAQKYTNISKDLINASFEDEFDDNKLIKYSKNNLSKTIKILSKDKIDKISGIILICINFDGPKKIIELKKFFNELSSKVQENSTIIIESTLIPGTCEKLLFPIIKKQFKKRNLNINKLSFGYSYERIMPGDNYVNSIIENYKNISGINNFSKKNILRFYKTFLNYKNYTPFLVNSKTHS